MQYSVPAGTEAHAVKIGDPFAPWTPTRTKRLQRFTCFHEVHDEHFVIASESQKHWKLLVPKEWVWSVDRAHTEGEQTVFRELNNTLPVVSKLRSHPRAVPTQNSQSRGPLDFS